VTCDQLVGVYVHSYLHVTSSSALGHNRHFTSVASELKLPHLLCTQALGLFAGQIKFYVIIHIASLFISDLIDDLI